MRPSIAIFITAGSALAALCVGALLDLVLRFAYGERLFLLGVPVAMVAAWCAYEVWRSRALERFGRLPTLRQISTSLSKRRRRARVVMTVVATALVVIAYARPQWGERTREIQRRGIDIVFAVDLSRSMLSDDVTPSRLETARAEIDRTLRRLDGDRVGLVVFAANAVRQSPLTSDYGAIRHYISRVHPDHFSRQGTAIGRAIDVSTQLLIGGDNPHFERAQTQIIVVIGDGEDTMTDPIRAATLAAQQGIRIYTIGIGTLEGGRIPVRDASGNFRGYLHDREQNLVITRLEEEQLIEIAAVGGGAYHRFTSEGSIAAFVEDAVQKYDREALESMLRAEYEDRYIFFLFPGLILLLIATLSTERRRAAATVALAALAAQLMGCEDALMRPDPHVERAISHILAGEVDQARSDLDQAPHVVRESPPFAFNRGLLHELSDELDDARAAYLLALSDDDPERHLDALFALGNALLGADELDEAITRYQRVLRLDPAHEGARRNLEIALRLKFPPCAALDDAFEPNNTPGDAEFLPFAAYRGDFVPPGVPPADTDDPSLPRLVACGGDADLWVIPSLGGALMDVEVTFQRLRADTGGAPPPDTITATDVRITLIGADGETTVAVDQGLATPDGEPVTSLEVAAASIQRALREVTLDPSVVGETHVYLKVEAMHPLEYTYRVAVEMTPPCYALEDMYEPNDTAEEATPIATGEMIARICPDNEDWYAIDLAEGDALFVDIAPMRRDDGGGGQLYVDLYVDSLRRPHTSTVVDQATGLGEIALYPDKEPRSVWVRVRGVGDEDAGYYTLDVHHFPPCPEGNDRYEPNNYPDVRTMLGPEDPAPYRHLRICPGDIDWFEIALPEREEDEADQPRPFSVVIDYPEPERSTTATVFDTLTGQPIMVTTPVLLGESTYSPAEPLLQGSAGATLLDPHMQSVAIRVEGDPGFYHLLLPDTDMQSPDDSSDSSDDDDDADDDSDDDSDESDDDTTSADDAPEDDASEGDETDQIDDARADDDNLADDAVGADEEERQREELMNLLNSLERDDINLQIIQALENLPPEEVQRPW